MLVLVGLVAGALIIAGAGTLAVARHSARADATRQLLQQASDLSQTADEVRTPRVLRVVDEVLKLQGGEIIRISNGTVSPALPNGVTLSSTQLSSLSGGHPLSGWQGNVAYAVVSISQSLLTARFGTGEFALILTRSIGPIGPSWSYFVLVTGIVLVVAALLGVWLSRRITRPLVDATALTERVARGELSARLQTRPGDIQELRTLTDSINSMATRLEGTRERERRMLLSVSHDLRTPLTSIRGYAEAIQDGVAESPSAAAGIIVAESRRLERLVADLLDLARLEASSLSLHFAPTDVAAVVSETVEARRPEAEARRLLLDHRVPAGPPMMVNVDPDRLGQVVANLVDNALAHARSAVSVTVEQIGPAGGLVVTVEDDGRGIPPADLPRIFEPFYQADRSSRGGLGLGLAIVAELLRAMGGHIEALSPLGPHGGTRMLFSLQLARPAEPPTPPAPPPPPPTPPTPAHPRA
jgi:signal transduction histidine kinase